MKLMCSYHREIMSLQDEGFFCVVVVGAQSEFFITKFNFHIELIWKN